jgi:hypothetical protein
MRGAVAQVLYPAYPHFLSRLVGARPDPGYRLGAKAGAGLNLHLGKNAMVFSTYEIMSLGGVPPAGARTPE